MSLSPFRGPLCQWCLVAKKSQFPVQLHISQTVQNAGGTLAHGCLAGWTKRGQAFAWSTCIPQPRHWRWFAFGLFSPPSTGPWCHPRTPPPAALQSAGWPLSLPRPRDSTAGPWASIWRHGVVTSCDGHDVLQSLDQKFKNCWVDGLMPHSTWDTPRIPDLSRQPKFSDVQIEIYWNGIPNSRIN